MASGGRVLSGSRSPFDQDAITPSAPTPPGSATTRACPTTDNLVTMLRASVERVPRRRAVAEVGGRSLTYRELWDAAARVAGGLAGTGVRPGDRVALRLGDGVDRVVAFFGAQLARALAVPVNTRLAEEDLRCVLDDSGALVTLAAGDPLPDGPPLALGDAAAGEVAAISYTSGTGGFPGGAMTAHHNFVSNAETARRVIGMPGGAETSTLVSVPLFHVTGCNSQLLALIMAGGTTVVMPAFEAQAFLRAVQEERIDNLASVPAIYWPAINQANSADFDLSSVRYLSYGGAPIAPDLVRAVLEHFPTARVGNGFDLTETSSIATYLPHEQASAHADSVGFAAPVVDVDLAGVDERSGVGELLVRGPNVVAGYWQKSDAAAEAFAGGWLHTGDLARIDGDGLVHIVDRAKDMIGRGGENVYCVEV